MEISNSDLIVNIYEKWLFQKRGIDDLEPVEIGIIKLISESSFRYGCKYAYIKYEDFGLAKATVSKYIKKLQEKKILKVENSYKSGSKLKRKNKYTLLYPDYLNFKFYCKQQKEEPEEVEIPQL